MAKYLQVFEEMIQRNQELFDSFKVIHDNYVIDPKKWKNEFNEKGQDVLIVISRFETRLCGKSENSGFGKFSSSLSIKFWEEVKKLFPKVEEIGVE